MRLIQSLLLLGFLLALAVTPFASEPAVAQENDPRVSDGVWAALQQSSGDIPVIISLRDPLPPDAPSAERQTRVAEIQNSTLSRLSSLGFRAARTFSHVPAISGMVNARMIDRLRSDPNVIYIQIDEPVQAHTGQSVPAIGADIVHSTYGLTGAGVTVAVLDTGINTTHVDLADSLVAQHCFTGGGINGDCQPGNVVESTSAEDLNGHGSNVSGVITANGIAVPVGFAPDAGIVAVRVLDRNNGGWVSDWIAGLNWIIANQGTLGVDVINMSLGTFQLHSANCDASYPATVSAISQLQALGIVIFASSGNQGSATSIASPACNSGVIAVGATYDSNLGRQPVSGTYSGFFGVNCFDAAASLQTITCFTNSSSMLDILAPGAPITSAWVGSTTAPSTYYGTSQASPTAAGVAALLLQANPALTPAQIENVMKSTGTIVTDAKNGLQFPRIDALEAVRSVTAPKLQTPYNPSGTINLTITKPSFTWTSLLPADSYEMQLDTVNPPAVTVYTGPNTQYIPASPLPLGNYYWRVRAVKDSQPGAWSIVGSITIESSPLAAPQPNVTTDTTPTLSWNRVDWATQYEIQIDTLSTFASPITYPLIPAGSLSFTVPVPLTPEIYFWRVRATAPGKTGAWVVDTFTVIP